MTTAVHPLSRLVMVRHGATAPNLAHVRCGGDLDVPLTEIGREQALAAARRLRALGLAPGLIVTSPLERTQETARIVAAELGIAEIRTEAAFTERRLGEWNLRPVDETEPLLRAKAVPPGGEADEDFIARIAGALAGVLPLLPRLPLLVGSKGVGRAIGVLLQQPLPAALANGEVAQFDLAHWRQHTLEGCTP